MLLPGKCRGSWECVVIDRSDNFRLRDTSSFSMNSSSRPWTQASRGTSRSWSPGRGADTRLWQMTTCCTFGEVTWWEKQTHITKHYVRVSSSPKASDCVEHRNNRSGGRCFKTWKHHARKLNKPLKSYSVLSMQITPDFLHYVIRVLLLQH